MRVMVFMKATEDSERGMDPTPETMAAFAAMDAFTEELVAAGVFVAAAGLKPSAEGRRIAFDGAARTVVEGPFADPGTLVAGFSIWEVRDMDEAVAWASRCPNPMPGPSEIEIRPFFEAADLAGFVTPDDLSTPRAGERGKLGLA
ncbi:YciI family protein [Sphingomonas profundi]|uniref:YciI family protein n=1 Tax=Alterirhizorhabdus profundi TaxID=2681549 RepID=UPI0012E8B9CE